MSDVLEKLVAEFIERRENGEALRPEEFAAGHADAGPALLDALRAVEEAEGLFPSTGVVERHGRIGPWRVEGELGRGGAGRVLRVTRAAEPGREYALKLLNLSAAGNPRALQRFRREGKLLEDLEHPRIVRVHEVAIGADVPYLVMDLVEGPSLAKLLSRARREKRTSRVGTPPTDLLGLPGQGGAVERAIALVAELARAVEFAHERGLLHRDLKPANVLLDACGSPVLADFGLAVHEDSATLTESGDLLGTPNYMSPEQARGERADGRTDVYGLGAVLYELLTLHPPQQGEDPLQILERIRKRPVTPVRRRNSSVSPALARVVHRALAWRKERRYPSAAALADDLDALLAGRRPAARGAGALERAEDLVRFRPRTVTLAALVGLALIAVFAPLRSDAADTARRLVLALDVAWTEKGRDAVRDAAHQLLAEEPSSAWGLATLADLDGDGDYRSGDAAVDAFVDGLHAKRERDRDGARAAFERASLADPDWAVPFVYRGYEDLADAELESAANYLSIGTRLLPVAVRPSMTLSYVYRMLGREEDAATESRRLVAHAPGSPDAWSALAAALAKTGELGEALVAIERAIALAPEPTPNMQLRKGAILDGLGRSDEAQAIFEAMLAAEPEDTLALGNLARALDGECRASAARRAYEEVLEISPRDFRALISLANIATGAKRDTCDACRVAFEAEPELFDPDAALEYTERALEVDGGKSDWLPNYVVDFAVRTGRYGAFRALLEKELEGRDEVDAYVVRLERALRKLDEIE